MTVKETQKAPSGRPQRKAVGTRNRLEIINRDPNRSYRLISSDPARVYQFTEAGYRVENIADFLPGSQRLGEAGVTDNSLPVGGGARHVLVSLEREFFEEDQKAKAARVDATEASIKPSDEYFGKVEIQR